MLHFNYIVKRGDNLTKLGKKFSFKNPGPIYYFPLNKTLFTKRKNAGNLLHPGDKIFVPWHLKNLDKAITTSRHLIREVQNAEKKLIKQEIRSKNELDDYLKKIDAVNFLATIAVNITGLAINGARGAAMSSKELLNWLINDRVKMAGDVVSTFVVDSPNIPKRNFRFYIRHGLGPWNPSYWSSVYTAIKNRDIDTYLYGTSSPHKKNVDFIIKQTKLDVSKLLQKIKDLERQKSESFYNKRI